MLARELLTTASIQLKNNDIKSYSLDAMVIMMHLLNVDKIELLTKNIILNDEQIQKYNEMIEQRKAHKPVAYITNNQEFMGLNFYVDENTLIPRCDTEVLVEKAIEIIKNNGCKNLLDIGTGTGCIPISIYKNTGIECVGIDINEESIEIAKRNAINNECNDIKFIVSDLYSNVAGKYDIITSNPPYINKHDMKHLQASVKDYEPHRALAGGVDGLDFYRKIIKNAKNYLNDNGAIVLEIGYNQKNAVTEMLEIEGYKDVACYIDLYGHDRVVVGFL